MNQKSINSLLVLIAFTFPIFLVFTFLNKFIGLGGLLIDVIIIYKLLEMRDKDEKRI